jgi:(S)-citramalyl-CoA lyase
MAADFGADAAWGPLLHARGRIVTACALAGIAAIDSPYFAIQDTQGLTQETQAAAAMGFAAKAAIHPEQVAAINAVLTPSPAEVENARQIMSACEAGAAQVNGRMVDAAMARHARRVLANAGRERKEGLLF